MPAPTRMRTTSQKFPQRWGYAVSGTLIVAGIIVGIAIAAAGLKNLYDDVNALRRNINNGEMLVSAERGDYVIYDEDGFDVGPFDVRVIRDSDEAVIPTIPISDGVSYDVDGNDGTARASVRLPTDDLYRIDVGTSVGDVAKFAFGVDVGAGPTDYILRGVVIGGITSILGVLLLFWTLVQHARWRLRSELSNTLLAGRDLVGDSEGAASTATAQSRTRASSLIDRASSAAERGIARARDELEKVSDPSAPGSSARLAPPPPPPQAGSSDWRASVAERANDILAAAESKLAEGTSAANDYITTADTTQATEAADTALERVQARIDAGESLRSIARDESSRAREGAAELRAQADAQAAEARLAAAELAADAAGQAGGVVDQVRSEADAIGGELRDVGESFGDQLFAHALEATELVEPIAEGLGDDAATAGVAAAASASAVVASRIEAVAPELGADDSGDWEADIASWVAETPAVPEPTVSEAAAVPALAALAEAPDPAPVLARELAPRLEPVARGERSRPSTVPAAKDGPGLAPFAVSGPPTSASIIAPPPAAQLQRLAAPPTPAPLQRHLTIDVAESQDAPPPPPPAPNVSPPIPDTLHDSDLVDSEVRTGSETNAVMPPMPAKGVGAPPSSGFSLAPAPDYGSIDTKPLSAK